MVTFVRQQKASNLVVIFLVISRYAFMFEVGN